MQDIKTKCHLRTEPGILTCACNQEKRESLGARVPVQAELGYNRFREMLITMENPCSFIPYKWASSGFIQISPSLTSRGQLCEG